MTDRVHYRWNPAKAYREARHRDLIPGESAGPASSNRVPCPCEDALLNREECPDTDCPSYQRLHAIPNRVPITREDEQRALDKGMAEERAKGWRFKPERSAEEESRLADNLHHATRNRVQLANALSLVLCEYFPAKPDEDWLDWADQILSLLEASR